MNILFFTHYSSLYGANKSLLSLLINKNKSEMNFIVVIPEEGPFTEELKKQGINYRIVPFVLNCQTVPVKATFRDWLYVRRVSFIRFFHNVRLIPQLLRIIKKSAIDTIYSNSSVISIGWWLSLLTSARYILHIRELREAHYGIKPDWGNFLFRSHLNSADHKIAISKTVFDYYNLNSNSSIVYNGIEMSDLPEELTPPDSKLFSFGVLGHISHKKGHYLILEAFAKFMQLGHNAQLVIAGGGDIEDLKHKALDLGIQDAVSIIGYVPTDVFFAQIHSMITASQYEAFGRTTVESMLFKRPVIGLNDSGTAEIISDEKTGFLFELNPDSLLEQMLHVFINYTSLDSVINRAYDYAKYNFSSDRYVNEIFRVINQTCDDCK